MISQLHFGISNICNLKCKHCFVKNKKITFLNLDKFFLFFDALERQGLTHIYYTYGEPLINDNFFQISKYIESKGIFQILMTNGVLIDKKMAEKIKESGINRVMISLDSSIPEEHDINRGVKGTFTSAVKAIKLLLDNNVSVGIATTVMKSNYDQLYEIETLANSLGVTYISFLAERQNGKVTLDLNEQYVSLFKKAVLEDRDYYFHDERLIEILNKMYLNKEISIGRFNKYKNLNTCHIKRNLSLAPNGDIYKCNFINSKPILNINDNIPISNMIEKIEKTCVKGCDFHG